jgi:hypothetical protein
MNGSFQPSPVRVTLLATAFRSRGSRNWTGRVVPRFSCASTAALWKRFPILFNDISPPV